MTPEQLRALPALANLTLDKLREAAPSIADALEKAARDSERERVEAALASVPEAAPHMSALASRPLEVAPLAHVAATLASANIPLATVNSIAAEISGVTLFEASAARASIAAQPQLATLVELGRAHQVTKLAGLSESLSGSVATRVEGLSGFGNENLEALVADGVLSAEQASATGFAAALYELSDSDFELATTIGAHSFSALAGNASTTTELARLRPADWRTFLETESVELHGQSIDVVAARLAARFGSLHPQVALGAGLPTIPGSSVLDEETLTIVAASYPGLGLLDVFSDPQSSPIEKAAAITRRIGFVRELFKGEDGDDDEGELNVLDLDLSTGSSDIAGLGLAGLGATEEEQVAVAKTLRSYQRIWVLSADIEQTLELVRRGFTSASAIARLSAEEFASEAQLPRAKAGQLWQSAREVRADSALTTGAVGDVIGGSFEELAVANTRETVVPALASLAGFDDLFGSLSFCACEHCQSILGPAAYFVDLMEFVTNHVLEQFPVPGHPLDLRTRRPDLWTLELSCANTNERVPTLSLVGRILENDTATRLGFSGDLEDRLAVEDLVYRETLATRSDSFAAPFQLPLVRANETLRALGSSRALIARTVGADSLVVARAQLGVSKEAWSLLTVPQTELSKLSSLYGVDFGSDADQVAPIDVQDLLRGMNATREEVTELVGSTFASAGGASVSIRGEKRTPKSVQNDIERVHGLSADALDRIHRLSRLAKALGWAISELDTTLAALGETSLDEAAAALLSELAVIESELNVSRGELAAMVADLPVTPTGASVFDSIFNPPDVIATDGSYPDPSRRFVHPAFRDSGSDESRATASRLSRALAISIDELATLSRALAPHLSRDDGGSLDPDATSEDERFYNLTLSNLSLLFRHVRIARAFGLELDRLSAVLGTSAVSAAIDLESLLSLVSLLRWLESQPLSVTNLALVLGDAGGATQSAAADDTLLAAAIVGAVAAECSFKDTVFAAALGTSENGSQELVSENSSLFQPAALGTFWLKAELDLENAPIVIPPSATISDDAGVPRLVGEDEIREVLRPYRASGILARRLGAALGVKPAKLHVLAAMTKRPLASAELVRAARGDGSLEPLVALVTSLRPMLAVFGARSWDAEALEFVSGNPSLFGNEPLPVFADPASSTPRFTLDQLRGLAVVGRLRSQIALDSRPLLDQLLVDYDDTVGSFRSDAGPILDSLFAVSSGVCVGLLGALSLPRAAALALRETMRAALLAEAIGIDGGALVALASEEYAVLSSAADALALVSDAASPATAKKLETANETLLERKRDALVDALTRSLATAEFATAQDLYNTFLTDVFGSGCSTTSPVVAAISSVQIYIQRVLMNLEADGLLASDPEHISLSIPAEAAAEWSWRKNYRVWEANRRVFLWPENILEPDLRDDKTPLFKELEEELLQTDISDQQVVDAYAKYLRGFEELASLTVAGAYHDVQTTLGKERDILHLFGVSAGDPATFFYRTCENLIASGKDATVGALWTPWHPVEVKISGRRVSPVVHRGRLHAFWVDTTTRPVNSVKGGESEFAGYRHQMSVHFATLRPDESWSPPQKVQLPVNMFQPGSGTIRDPLKASDRPQHDTRSHTEAIEDYTLRGPTWDSIWLAPVGGRLHASYRNLFEPGWVDLFGRDLSEVSTQNMAPSSKPQVLCAKNPASSGGAIPLFRGTPVLWWHNINALPNAAIEESRLDAMARDIPVAKPLIEAGLYKAKVADCSPKTQFLAVPGSVEDCILQVGNDILLLQGSATTDESYVLSRIGTTLAEKISRRLYEGGIDALLDLQFQVGLREADTPISVVPGAVENRSNRGKLDFKGPYGVYFRELFFHIPALIANALNGRGEHAAAQRWYHYIFDPSATGELTILGPQAPNPNSSDRVWRYSEFRNLGLARMRDVLSDETALELYKKNPFNPHAIARRRLSAYPKAIVMKYVENLIDWADSLFTQFTMESVNEALMLYVMASEILGERPAALGSCGEGAVSPKNYETIAPLIGSGAEFLIELETWLVGQRLRRRRRKKKKLPTFALPRPRLNRVLARRSPLFATPLSDAVLSPVDGVLAMPPKAQKAGPMFEGLGWNQTRIGSWGPEQSLGGVAGSDGARSIRSTVGHKERGLGSAAGFAPSLVSQLNPVFCVPANRTLHRFWDRVSDRLFKIRHCLDITGQKRELALFAPEIDPALLSRIRAEGLTLEEILDATSGDLPPYRFLFLVDRARAFASSLSGFGAALLSALEKKDAEELARLRLVHQKNLSQMTTQIRRLEIESAEQSAAAARRRMEAAEYRKDFYQGLLDNDRNSWEVAESTARHAALGLQTTQVAYSYLSAAAHMLPQIGSPFSMKFGGLEVGMTFRAFAQAGGGLASVAHGAADSAGLEGNFARRREGWEHQKKLATIDSAATDRQVRAAEIRLELAKRGLAQHEQSLEQIDAVLELTDNRFTNLGLYTHLAAQLQVLYRDAYQNALGLARLAERAFQFERSGVSDLGLAASYWDGPRAGLLAGERLLVDLQTLERTFLETNYREHEVDQTLALSQIDPQALLKLRTTGECEFDIPEVFFDLYYPGHYRRRIRNTRLTIPCITGPYANVSATLELVRSWVRTEPDPSAPLLEVPSSRTTSVATSTAQNDAGVFELSFRDERYMPFEGAGAVSRWRLALPKTFRQFDYATINDALLSMSYTAQPDTSLRAHVEAENASLEGSILAHFATNPAKRVLSLRQDFSAAFGRLLRSPLGTSIPFEITERHLPPLFRGRALTIKRGSLLVRLADGVSADDLEMTVDGEAVTDFESDPSVGGLKSAELPISFSDAFIGAHELAIASAGNVGPTDTVDAAADPGKLEDVLVYLEFTIEAS